MHIPKFLILSLCLTLSSPCLACEGALQGVVELEKKADGSICITVTPVGQKSETQCFNEGSKEYELIVQEYGDIKPGEVTIIEEGECSG